MKLSLGVSALTSLANKVEIGLGGGEKPLCELRIGPFVRDEFVVLHFHGNEGISSLFRFDVVVASRVESEFDLGGMVQGALGSVGKGALGAVGRQLGSTVGGLLDQAEGTALDTLLLGQPATLILHSPHGSPRLVQGIGSEIERLGPLGGESSDWHAYRIVVRPKLWLATLRQNSRIFQDVSVSEVVSTVLHEHGVEHRWAVATKFPLRAYTVQHQETDYVFVERLLAELGLFYFFEPPSGAIEDLFGGAVLGAVAQVGQTLGGGVGDLAEAAGLTETLVIGESASSYLPISGSVADGLVEAGMDAVSGVAANVGAAARSSFGGGLRVDSSGVHLGGSLSASGKLGSAANGIAHLTASVSVGSPFLLFQELVGLLPNQDHVFQFAPRRAIRPKSITLREFDYRRPNLLLSAGARADFEMKGGLGLSNSQRPLAFNTVMTAPARLRPETLEMYDHHDEYEETDVDRDHARIHLEQHRRDVRIAEGQSVSQRLIPGYRFTLEEHPLSQCNTDFAVTRVEHWAQVPEWRTAIQESAQGDPRNGGRGRDGPGSGDNQDPIHDLNYHNRFECVPAGVAYRLPRPPRRLWQVMETATVVGPIGDELYVDEFGRIKVQFHWDREGGNNEQSSCWIRVMHPWGGAGWGHQFIPRVGMEVAIAFLGGDPDKPVVLGSFYNGTHPMPFPLPSATRSGIKTQTTPGGDGYNELSFEDAQAEEEIRLHAQKDLNEAIRNDHNTTVGRHRSESVTGNRSLEVKGDSSSEVDGSRSDVTQGHHEATVHKNQSLLVHGNSQTTIDGAANLTVRERLNTQSGGEVHHISGPSSMAVAEDLTLRTHGCYTVVVGASDAERSSVLHVLGEGQVHSRRKLELSSDEEIVLKVGENSIRLTKDAIELQGNAISGNSGASSLQMNDKNVAVKSNGGSFLLSETALLKSARGGMMTMGKNAVIDAKKIALNSPLHAEEDIQPPPEGKPTQIVLTDATGTLLPNQPFVVLLKDGTRRSGVLDEAGKAEILLEEDAEIYFPTLSDLKAV